MLNIFLCMMGMASEKRLSLVMSMMVSFVLSFFPRDVLDEILNLIESVSEDFPSYSYLCTQLKYHKLHELSSPDNQLRQKAHEGPVSHTVMVQ